MDTMVSNRAMGIENEKDNQGSRRQYHGWLNSAVDTGEIIVKKEI
jgi:hypothetical protein